MSVSLKASRNVARNEEADSQRARGCPLCGAVLIPINQALRCARCGFVLCEGCESGSEES